MEKKGLVINGCMIQHMLIFKPHCNDVVAKEYLCDCKMCLSLSFDKCENTKNLNNSILEEISSVNNDSEWFCDSDETVNKSHILEFVDVPSFVAVLSNNLNEPVYFIKVEEKGIAECELRDRFGHVVLVDEPYFKGIIYRTFVLETSRNFNLNYFRTRFTLNLMKFTNHLLKLTKI